MFAPPVTQWLSGDRLHLSHGPIDVVLKAWGAAEDLAAAYAAVCRRFPTILPELCEELSALRMPAHERPQVTGPVARRMISACRPFADVFVTPMAAVAGAVADELLAHMRAAAPLQRAFVNDGGDIAVLVTGEHALDVGVAGTFSRGDVPAMNGSLRLDAGSGIGGIATSGARGRSFSLGIADSVTVLARDAAMADVAATLVANAVDIESPAIVRRPAQSLDPDSDLGDRLVTVSVGALTPAEVDAALARGLARAGDYHRRGLIADAALMLAGRTRTLGGDGYPRELVEPCDGGRGPSFGKLRSEAAVTRDLALRSMPQQEATR
ncbi:MAG: UPF0280 family protein [Hyphomicrobiaceae bacterium]|nr:MAG: UPF0280 family protein [Hyphomicrobiaceae bacterium]